MRFTEADADNAAFLHSVVARQPFDVRPRRLHPAATGRAGILIIDDVDVCTYADERMFSYRRSVHRKEPDYGRNIHAIVLEG